MEMTEEEIKERDERQKKQKGAKSALDGVLVALADMANELQLFEKGARRQERDAQIKAESFMEARNMIEIKMEKLKREASN